MVLPIPGIAKLVSALLSTNHQAVNSRLVECGTLDALLDLFFRYSLNNFLHSTVEGCLAQVIEWKGEGELQEDPDKTME